MITPEIYVELCTGCGECVEACPVQALALEEDHAALVNADDCQYCGDCEDLCPEGAIARPFEVVLADPGERARIEGSVGLPRPTPEH
jgi:NAD-dependent dihydropyrimidine dehydrogenase PreA subunit